MIDFPYIKELAQPTPSKIVMLVVDGLGGLPHPDTGMSELEAASLPNLDSLASQSACGLTTPVAPGITPGSGPGHMALFGYDPVKYLMGRGVIEALGIGVELGEGDVAARGNLCTVDTDGLLVDRRAGRIASAESAPLIDRLNEITVPDANLSVYPVRDYRFVLVLRGNGLGDNVSETDPQLAGKAPIEAQALSQDSQASARAVILRGFSRPPNLPRIGDYYRLKPAAVAAYPMYRGVAKLVGMDVLATGPTFDQQLDTLGERFADYDFFFLHYKPADAAGEDGNFDAKVAALEELDGGIPRLLDLDPDTLVVAGDHSTPAVMGSHSWHPVPLLVRSPLTKGQGSAEFTERACAAGSLGRIAATSVITLALAHAGKLRKFGP